MADLIAYQDGNWTGSTTWKGVATGTGAKQATITNSTNTTTTDVASSNFTIGNGTVCEGMLLHCRRLTTNGTVTVGLYLGTTLQREVTVNATDLPPDQSWVFFEFATTLTAGNGSTYNVRVRGSNVGNAAFFRDATAGNWARYIRNGTTATAAATDVTFICDELTGAGTKVDVTVTMNSTASTAYGECNIGQGGVLSFGTSASTNYILDLAGNLNVWGGGTLNIGTSGTPMPSTSTALLEFTNATNVDRGLEVRGGGTCNLYGATKTTTNTLLTADAASGQNVLTVQSTSGWAANDVVGIPSTTRDRALGEKRTISTVDSATQVTLSSNLTNTHHGTSPFEGEVMNLTRNVKVRGTSQSLCAYVNCNATSNFTAEYVEFSFLGSGTSQKRGIDLVAVTGSANIRFCSFYDYNSTLAFRGIAIETVSTYAYDISDNSFFLGGSPIIRNGGATGAVQFKRNYVASIGTAGSTNNFSIFGDVTDNRLIGCNLDGTNITEMTSFSNNVVRSAGVPVTISSSRTIDNLKCLRSNAGGLSVTADDVVFTNCTFSDNATYNVTFGPTLMGFRFTDCTFNGGTGGSGAAQTTAHFSTNRLAGALFDNCSFSAVSNPTNFFEAGTTAGVHDVTFRKCVTPATVNLVNQANLSDSGTLVSGLKFDKFNNTSGSHRTYKRYGRTEADQATYKTAAPSEALLPNNASNKLPSGSKKFAVASGTTATVNVWVNKSGTYNGNQPRLIVKANSIAGITTDTVLDTMSVGTGTWEELSGTTATVSDDCVLEVYVDCDGTAGTVYVDDWSVT